MGGGVGVRYKDENPFPISQLAEAIVPIVKKLNVDLFFEPGRFLTANAGVLIAKVLYTKQNGNKNFIVVDTAMTDLLRPSIYGAYHHIQPVSLNAERKRYYCRYRRSGLRKRRFSCKEKRNLRMQAGRFAFCNVRRSLWHGYGF